MKLWGGRFTKKTDRLAHDFNESLSFDCRFWRQDIRGSIAHARMLADRGVKPDVICVDPPRKGLALPVIETIAEMAPKRLVYVSCDPATLARDVKLLGERGYRLVKAEAADLFPRSFHCETVLYMTKK